MRRLEKRIVIAGATGGIGKRLIERFAADGFACVALSRGGSHVEGAIRSATWMGTDNVWMDELDGAYAVINLSGESIAQRWTDSVKNRLIASRIGPTQAIGAALERVEAPPLVWVNASATGYYGDVYDPPSVESDPPGSDFLAELCAKWEVAATTDAPTVVSIPRVAVVLDGAHGYLPTMVQMAKRLMGGRAGDGRQWLSWIHIDDLTRAIAFAIESQWQGPWNAASPEPVQNRDFADQLAERLGLAVSPPTPAWAIRLGAPLMGIEPTMALSSSRVVPQRLFDAGFEFAYPTLDLALREILG